MMIIELKYFLFWLKDKLRYLAGLDGSIIILLCLNASSGCVIFY
tara:strand:+ start:283 stop:414 length:132 start_codon:yes stop_codon:yes gene_type:complete